MIAQVLNTAIIVLLVILILLPAGWALAKTLRQHMTRRRLAQARSAGAARLEGPGAS